MKKKLLMIGMTLLILTALLALSWPSTIPTQVSATTFLGSKEIKLIASDGMADDVFGTSCAISGDTVVIGARSADSDTGANSGAAYVFVRSGSSWLQQAKLTAGDGASGDQFGNSVAISGDTLVVGAYLDDDAGMDSGSAYVFVRSGSSWLQQAKLTAGDGAATDIFGSSVAISGDTAVVGAYLDDDAGMDSGSAYIYQSTPIEYELLQEHLDTIEGKIDSLTSKVEVMSGGIDYLKEAAKKLDIEFLMQSPTPDVFIYVFGVSLNGLPVDAYLSSAHGIRVIEGDPPTPSWDDVTGNVFEWSTGTGHLGFSLNSLSNADEYWMFQFVIQYDDGNITRYGTINVVNNNFGPWAGM